MESRIEGLNDAATASLACSPFSSSEDMLRTRKAAAVLLAEYMQREGLTDQAFRIANACVRHDQEMKDQTSLQHLKASLESHVSNAQFQLEAKERLQGLHYAALYGMPAGISFFCLAGSSVNQPSQSEGTHRALQPIHLALFGCHEEALLQLLERGANLSARTGSGQTCLHIATVAACANTLEEKEKEKTLGLLRLILQKASLSTTGLDPEDGQGFTPFDIAAESGNEEVTRVLEDAGARGNTRHEVDSVPTELENTRYIMRHSLTETQSIRAEAIKAVENGSLDRLQAILDDDAARMALRNHIGADNSSILHLAVRVGRDDLLAAILSKSIIDVDHKNDGGDTALHVAASTSNVAVVETLISHGAGLELPDARGMVPLHITVTEAIGDQSAAYAMVQHYLSSGVGINVPTSGGWTALHLAVELGLKDLTRYLISNKANTEATSQSSHGYVASASSLGDISRQELPDELGGWRPLHVAALKGDEATVRMLLENGAQRSAKDNNGVTAIERAAAGHHYAVVKLLLFGLSSAPLISIPAPPAPLQPSQPVELIDGNAKASKRQIFKKAFRLSKAVSPGPNQSPAAAPVLAPTALLLPQLLSYPEAIDALHASIRHGNADIVKLLMPYSLANYVSPSSGMTPTSTAALHGRVDMISLLLAGGANPVLTNPDGTTAVHIAAGHREARVFQVLERFSWQVQDDFRISGRGRLLLAAVATGSPETVKRLIQRDLAENKSLWPYQYAPDDALWTSISTCKPEMSQVMVRLGWPCHFNHVVEAIHVGDASQVSLVCATKENALSQRDTSDRNAFHICAEMGSGDLLRLLLGLWCGPGDVTLPLTAIDKQGYTPFLIAVSKGNTLVAEVILELLPDERWRSHGGVTLSTPGVKSALSCACWPGHMDTILMLVNHMDYTSYTAKMLMEAMVKDQKLSEHALPVIDAILKHRPDLTESGQLNSDYDEILVTAATFGGMGLVQLLLPHLTSQVGRHQVGQALVAAAWHGHEELTMFIWNDNHDVQLMPCANESLYLAATVGHAKIVKGLLASPTGTAPFTTEQLRGALEAAAVGDHIAAARAVFETAGFSKDNGVEVLHSAIRENNDKMVRALLTLGVDAQLLSADGWTPLHAAIISSHQRVAEVLLDHGININSMSGESRSPIHQAVVLNNGAMVAFLLDKGAKTKLGDDLGDLPIHLAAKFGSENAMEKLCSHESVDSDMFHTKNHDGKTPMDLALANPSEALRHLLRREAEVMNDMEPSTLHFKCCDGSVDTVKVLLEYGADPKIRNKEKYLPLHSAVANNNEAVVRLLIDSGKCDLEARQCDGITPLALAIQYQYIAVAKLLHEAGANINTKKDFQDWQPIHGAARYSRLESLKYLIDAGADVLAKSEAGLNALHLAACGGHVEATQLLLDKGVPIEDMDNEQRTPLIWAINEQHPSVVKLLLKSGAKVNYSSERTQLPLHQASRNDMTELVEILLDAGANISQGDSFQQDTPLHYAAYFGKASNTRFLISRGANPRSKNKHSSMPLHVAANNGSTNAAEILLEFDPDVNVLSSVGRTPLMLAAWRQHGDFVRFIAGKGADLHTKDEESNNALMLASYEKADAKGSISSSVALLDLGADVNARNKNSHTALTFALLHAKRADLVKLYLSRGADPNIEVTRNDGLKQAAIF